MTNNIYINNNLVDRIHELRIKADEYLKMHSDEERNSWYGKYNIGDINPSQCIFINGLNKNERDELRVIGLMPHNEYFEMWVKSKEHYKHVS